MEELQLHLDQCLIHASHMRKLSTIYVNSVRYTCERFFDETGVKSLHECTLSRVENWLLK